MNSLYPFDSPLRLLRRDSCCRPLCLYTPALWQKPVSSSPNSSVLVGPLKMSGEPWKPKISAKMSGRFWSKMSGFGSRIATRPVVMSGFGDLASKKSHFFRFKDIWKFCDFTLIPSPCRAVWATFLLLAIVSVLCAHMPLPSRPFSIAFGGGEDYDTCRID